MSTQNPAHGHSVLKRNELSSHENTWRRTFSALSLNNRSQLKKATSCMLPTL